MRHLVFQRNNFIERSIMGALAFFKDSCFADEVALKKGWLQSLDPRVKAMTTLLFVVEILLAKDIVVVSALYGFSLALAYFSRIRLGYFLKRTWIFIPLFSFFIVLPALFSFFSPGEALATFKVAGFALVVTRQGAAGAALFVARVAASVSYAVLLSATTRQFELLKVLRVFCVPQLFVMVLGMCLRYIYLFVSIIENTYVAIKSRAGIRVHHKKGQRIVAWNIASLWMRSYSLSSDVYQAMLSRGFRGEPVVLEGFKARPRDAAWLALNIVLFVFLAKGPYAR
jgi:cobalt/nickel transport system permease protein